VDFLVIWVDLLVKLAKMNKEKRRKKRKKKKKQIRLISSRLDRALSRFIYYARFPPQLTYPLFIALLGGYMLSDGVKAPTQHA